MFVVRIPVSAFYTLFPAGQESHINGHAAIGQHADSTATAKCLIIWMRRQNQNLLTALRHRVANPTHGEGINEIQPLSTLPGFLASGTRTVTKRSARRVPWARQGLQFAQQ